MSQSNSMQDAMVRCAETEVHVARTARDPQPPELRRQPTVSRPRLWANVQELGRFGSSQ